MPLAIPKHLWQRRYESDAWSTPDEFVTAIDGGINQLAPVYVFERPDITYTVDEFRKLAETVRDDIRCARLVAALGSDGP
jgi:hypothetical protein